jgi:excisionase family DNA binding protein
LVTTDHERCQGGAPAKRRATQYAEQAATWLTYTQAATYTGWSIRHLRNLVSGGRIPVYGRPRVRRFRRDMLDLFLTNPDMAMRKFLSERN